MKQRKNPLASQRKVAHKADTLRALCNGKTSTFQRDVMSFMGYHVVPKSLF